LIERYFPHDANARHDPKMESMRNEFGAEGYGIYFMLIEIMFSQGGKLRKFPKMYGGISKMMNVSEDLLERFVRNCVEDYWLFQEDTEFIWSESLLRRIQVILDKRDKKVNAGRLGGIASGKTRSKTKQNEAVLEANEANEANKRKEIKETKEKKKEQAGLLDTWFEELWSKYPNKDGKRHAKRHFVSSVRDEGDYGRISSALENYLSSDRVKSGYIKNGSTWFNNWQDWVEYQEAKFDPKEFARKFKEGLSENVG